MTEHLNDLSCLIVEDLHGTFLAHIFKQLVFYGRLSHFHVAQRCHLPFKQAKSGLAALIQLRLVQHHTSPAGFSTYQADVNNAYRLVRIGKVVALAHAQCGPVAALVVEHIASNGSLSASQITHHLNLSPPNGEKVSSLKINRALRSLTSHGFLQKLRTTHSLILHDAREDIEIQVQQRLGPEAKAKGKKAHENQAGLLQAELEQQFDSHLPLDTFDNPHDEVDLNGIVRPSDQINDAIYICIDFDATVRFSCQDYVSQKVEKLLGRDASRVARAAVSQIGLPLSPNDTSADALRPPSVHTLAMASLRDTISHQAPAPTENGVHSTNGHNSDEHMINGIDGDSDGHSERFNLNDALSLISEGPFLFLIHDVETSIWSLDSLALSRWIRDKEIDNIISQRVGPVGLRIKRMLTAKGKLEEKTIQDLGLLVAKELRQTLAKLETQGLVELQEVPREPQRQPNRTIFLWFFDAERATKVLLGDLYKSMARLYQVIKKERENLRGTFEKLSRVVFDGKPEDYLLGEERKAYLQWQHKEAWLMAEIERLDESVALLRDM